MGQIIPDILEEIKAAYADAEKMEVSQSAWKQGTLNGLQIALNIIDNFVGFEKHKKEKGKNEAKN